MDPIQLFKMAWEESKRRQQRVDYFNQLEADVAAGRRLDPGEAAYYERVKGGGFGPSPQPRQSPQPRGQSYGSDPMLGGDSDYADTGGGTPPAAPARGFGAGNLVRPATSSSSDVAPALERSMGMSPLGPAAGAVTAAALYAADSAKTQGDHARRNAEDARPFLAHTDRQPAPTWGSSDPGFGGMSTLEVAQFALRNGMGARPAHSQSIQLDRPLPDMGGWARRQAKDGTPLYFPHPEAAGAVDAQLEPPPQPARTISAGPRDVVDERGRPVSVVPVPVDGLGRLPAGMGTPKRNPMAWTRDRAINEALSPKRHGITPEQERILEEEFGPHLDALENSELRGPDGEPQWPDGYFTEQQLNKRMLLDMDTDPSIDPLARKASVEAIPTDMPRKDKARLLRGVEVLRAIRTLNAYTKNTRS